MADVEYRLLEGGLFGDTIEDVVTFALISFLHDRIGDLSKFGNPQIGAKLRAEEIERDR